MIQLRTQNRFSSFLSLSFLSFLSYEETRNEAAELEDDFVEDPQDGSTEITPGFLGDENLDDELIPQCQTTTT